MSTDPDKATGCPNENGKSVTTEFGECGDKTSVGDECQEKKKTHRSVRFPDEDQIVTQYFEPANPWQDVPTTTRSQLAADYLESCRRHDTPCLDSVLQQIRELPESAIGGGARAPRLTLAECSLTGAAPADALEAIMRRVQFRRVELEHARIDDEGAEAIFDMIEYYESATTLAICGRRQFGIRGWQAASRMIKKSAELSELEVTDAELEASHAPVLARSLRAHTCRLRALCLQRVALCGEPLLCLVIALKSNNSIRELRLGDNRLSVSDAVQLASLLRYNTRIQLLDLSNNQIQDAGVAALAEALAEQGALSPPARAACPGSASLTDILSGNEPRGLAFLVLWNNQLTRNCAPYLNKALRSSQSLCVLNIGRNAVGSEAVRALPVGGPLVSLGLQAARLGPDAAAALAELVRADRRLQRLDLRENRLGGAGLQAILAAMKENSTLTQIDLDEPPDSTSLLAEDSEAALVRRVTREIRAVCRRNEPSRHEDEGIHPVHRKISLTCHTACLLRQGMGGGEEERRGGRLRSPAPSPAASPAPSPAGSPVPAPHPHSRFMVTRVTPERDSSTDSSSSTSSTPTRPYCPPSRFRVVQVMEPPQIQVHPASNQPRKSPSRFSVTRNYDTMYNPSPSPPPPSPAPSQILPVIYTQLENEVVTQLKNEALMTRQELAAQSKNDVVRQDLKAQSKIEAVTKTDLSALSKNETLKQDLVAQSKDVQLKSEIQSKSLVNVEKASIPLVKVEMILKSDDSRVKSDVSAKDSNTQLKNEIELPQKVPSPVKKVVTTQVRTELMKQNKNESLSLVKVEPSVKEVGAFFSADPMVKTNAADKTEEVQVKNDLTQPSNQATVKNEPLVRNIVTTQLKNDPPVKIEPIRIDQSSQASANIDSSTQVEIIRQVKYTEVEPIIVKNEMTTQPKTESATQVKNVPIESTSHINIDPVTIKPVNIESSLKTELPILPKIRVESSSQPQIKNVHNDPTPQIKMASSLTKVSVIQPKMPIHTIIESLTESDPENESCDSTKMSIEPTTSKTTISKTNLQTLASDSISNIESASGSTKSSTNVDVVWNSRGNIQSNIISDKPHTNTDSTISKLSTESSDLITKMSVGSAKVEQQTHELTSSTQTKTEKCTYEAIECTHDKPIATVSDSNVIEISIKNQTLVKSDLKYSDVLKSDKKINNTDAETTAVRDQNKDNATKIVAITEDLGNIINEMKVLVKNRDSLEEIVPADSVVLKKNKSESSLDSPDLEVSRLMEKRLEERSVFDSNSSLEICGSSMESLNDQNKTVQELDRRKSGTILSNESSMESASDATPVNSGNFLNLSLSSNESVSPIFGKTKVIHDSLSSLEASVSSLDSGRQEKIMVTSADSGIEYSLQHPSENREDNSSNEGTLTNNSSLKETMKKPEGFQLLDSVTSSPKRTSSLLDVPALKSKGLDRMRKISWVAPSSSFHIPRPDERETKPSHLEKLLSLFQHPTSIFSRSLTSDDEKKSASSTPPRKESSLTSSFWSWGSTVEKAEREEDSSEATDSTLSERVQVSFVDESFSRKLDSKTPSTDTDNTLSEFQSFPTQESECAEERVTITTEDIIVQNLDISVISNASIQRSDVDKDAKRSGDVDLLRDKEGQEKEEKEVVRPRSFAAVLKSSGSENSLDKQSSPDNGQSVDKLPSKVIRGIKENISPENTLTSSMTNTKALAVELERQVKTPTVNIWDTTQKNEPKIEEIKVQTDLAPIATIEETCDDYNPLQLAYIDDVSCNKDLSIRTDAIETEKESKSTEGIDLGKDALSYLVYEISDFRTGVENTVKAPAQQGSLAQELRDAEIKEILDLSPELVVDELQDNVFPAKEIGLRTSPIIPERAKLKKSNSLEDLSQLQVEEKSSPKTKTIAFKVPESTTPRDIPERRAKLRTRSGSSPKSLPESLNKPCPLTKMESILSKKKKKVSSLGKMARDSLLALNMSEEEIAEFRRSYKLTSVESLKSLESVSEDANSQSGNSIDSRCRACLRTSQESLMSLDSISEDCRCTEDCERPSKSAR